MAHVLPSAGASDRQYVALSTRARAGAGAAGYIAGPTQDIPSSAGTGGMTDEKRMMIGYDAALAIVLRQSVRLPPETVPAERAFARVLAEPVQSTQCLPPFDNSAMDGFALDTQGGQASAGREFAVAGVQVAGDAEVSATAGAWEITTGARLPLGLDAVVPIEQTEIIDAGADGHPLRFRLLADVVAGSNIRRRGEDVAEGVHVMRAGTCVQAPQLMLLSALGISQVEVVRRPRVAIIVSGRELVADPAQPLEAGQIRDSNGPYLHARLVSAGAEVVYRTRVGDDADEFLAALDQALANGADIVVTTGAVSRGRHDFIADALRNSGAEILFHKVRIRPAKPLLFARLPSGQLCFGLPGNPVSSAIGLRFFVEPALRAMLGMAPERPLRLPLAGATRKRADVRSHLHAQVFCDASGRLCASVLQQQQSFRLMPMLAADGWVVLPESASGADAGDMVDVYGLGHLQPLQVSGSNQDVDGGKRDGQ
jgi:molybdopterin molybdotransferase